MYCEVILACIRLGRILWRFDEFQHFFYHCFTGKRTWDESEHARKTVVLMQDRRLSKNLNNRQWLPNRLGIPSFLFETWFNWHLRYEVVVVCVSHIFVVGLSWSCSILIVLLHVANDLMLVIWTKKTNLVLWCILKKCKYRGITPWRLLGFGDFREKNRLNARDFARQFLRSGMLYKPSKSLKKRRKHKTTFLLGREIDKLILQCCWSIISAMICS